MSSERANELLSVVLEQHELVLCLSLNSSTRSTSNRLGSAAALLPTLDRGLAANRDRETSHPQIFDIKPKKSRRHQKYM